MIGVAYFKIIGGVGAFYIVYGVFALVEVFEDLLFFLFEEEDMAVEELFVIAVVRGCWVEAIAKMDKEVVFYGEGVDEFVEEGDLEDVVGVVHDELAGDEVVIEKDVFIEDAVVVNGSAAAAVLAEIGVAGFEQLRIGDIFRAAEEVGFGGEPGVVEAEGGVVGLGFPGGYFGLGFWRRCLGLRCLGLGGLGW